MFDVITIGDIKLDTFIVLPDATVMCELKMPECKLCIAYGKKIPVESFVTQIAGSAPNVAIGLTKMRLTTAVVSVMGDDDVAEQADAFLKRRNVETKYVTKKAGERSSAAVVLNYKGESTQLVDHADHVYRLPKKLPPCRFFYISELGNQYEQLFSDAILAAESGIKIGFNPGAVQIKERKPILFSLIAVTEVLFVNMREANALVENDNGMAIRGIVSRLHAMGPRIVVVTNGEHGAYAYDGKELLMIPAFKAKMVEATGAGDAFSTGFLGALLKGKSLHDALRFGGMNSASVVGAVGPTAGLLSHLEINKRLGAHPGYKAKAL